MSKISFVTVVIVLMGQALAATQPVDTVPPLPGGPWARSSDLESVAVDKRGEVTWISNGYDSQVSVTPSGARCYRISVIKRSWHPATGVASTAALPLQGLVTAQVVTPSGIMFLLAPECAGDPGRAALLRADNSLTVTSVSRAIFRARMVLLSDGAVAVVSVFGADDSDEQRKRDPGKRHFRAFIIHPAAGGMGIEQMPDLTLPSRDDFALAAMPGGRLMVLGGSDDRFRGCNACRRDTHILDPRAKRWSPGPALQEPRSEHAALALPDGSILVTGGWTPSAGWGKGPSRSAERWNPQTNRFEAITPMPTGTARHRFVWMPGRTGTLLAGGGTNSEVQAYDIETGSWHLAAAAAQGSEEGGCVFVPFLVGGEAYAWAANRSEGFYSSKDCIEQKYWQALPLRLAASGTLPAMPAHFGADGSFVAYQSHAAFVPASANEPALLIGGTTHAGMNSYLVTAGATAIGVDRTVRALPSLNEPRSDALAFRVGNGVLVARGHGEQDEGQPLPMEWLAANMPEARWIRVSDSAVHPSSALGQAADESLVEVAPDGTVRLLRLTFDPPDEPAIAASELPNLGWARRSSANGEEVRVRGLAAGGVVVAGGEIQTDKVALLTPDSLSGEGPDQYVGIGPYSPSRRHDIYDPVIKVWRASAPSPGDGGRVTIMDDGRVAKISRFPGADGADPRYELEISTADGTAWSTVRAEELAPMRISDSTKPFVVDGELFLSGELVSLSTGGGPSGVVWFNTATRRWEVLWRAAATDNWRYHVGRVIVHPLANGKVVVVPVDGF